ncbi:MAG: response regulator transcription factor [Solirubrobacteraceae bacterium]
MPATGRHTRRSSAKRSTRSSTAAASGHARSPSCSEPLSEREQAILRYLPTMMSNHEIAGELFVSVNTVKTHLKAIYRKLDASGRREAVQRGREHGLMP